VLGRSGRVAIIGAEQALHPLLLGALGGGSSCALSVGEFQGVEAAPDRLAVDLVLDREVSGEACRSRGGGLRTANTPKGFEEGPTRK
jgi:hypothetical protein